MRDHRKAASYPQSGKKPRAVFDSPFRKLKSLISAHAQPTLRSGPPSTALNRWTQTYGAGGKHIQVTKPSVDDEALLLREALDGVRPIAGSKAERVGVEPMVVRNIVSEDAEVL